MAAPSNSEIEGGMVTPECGYSTVSWPSSVNGSQSTARSRVDYDKIQAILRQITLDYTSDHLPTKEQLKKRQQLKKKYSQMSKDLEDTRWMYLPVDEILKGRTSFNNK